MLFQAPPSSMFVWQEAMHALVVAAIFMVKDLFKVILIYKVLIKVMCMV